ncbi:hypothetical protein [Deinococcus radiodurans]|jgi:hypothetical protein|uniref:Uncharacterized protein n=1 Tax=Deinococcus radiodurans (strain ATCC 13939 / DSM 20539 / JCM 16871 / CCUG 27074 / LMG 4051 / NBRC 15346 / NCIMB 9279 / VKM B-1422 / R1) TaxID=243230 RepID=Q9RW05_DEIRA|nr:hypothetical protein [Deinococcus radiodurans]AAF10447.1 hypothetical protein DR_0864 [Deinococcus radiodurans R1 = ATCC 13939 = DSM 20539]ANC71929.1 hypothetical protein A2G07_09185 [Deinococcus radiodurans R1 = ATCC 13939 = DSM 20539]QEM70373.1 hypothetical protein DXG80_00390 [Deinococcus radiodurans]UDL00023.1 hypothetical protein E5E91_04480 [Deinococcus radiodurans R1 = ATCC 13939 = DSM 20539]UID69860.1 hypothetical protein DRO_0860 [Deinococcus radiodurans R1 = ATCC 13939 = DSM 20539
MADSKDIRTEAQGPVTQVQTIQAQPAVTHEPVPAQPPVQSQAPVSRAEDQSPVMSGTLVRVGENTDVRYLNEQEEARERLKASVDRLTQQASLQVKVEKEPLKMLGGASAVGAVIGLVLGRQLRRSKKIYVDAHSPVKHQREFVKAQQRAQNNKNNVGGALLATLGTMAVKMLTDKVLAPKLEEVANNLLDKAGQPSAATRVAAPSNANATAAASNAGQIPTVNRASTPVAPAAAPAQTQSQPQVSGDHPHPGVHYTANPVHPGVVPIPDSVVEAKAQGTPISEDQKVNPNLS